MTEWSIIWEARGAFLNGALNTLILFALSVLAAFAIGCFSVYLLEGRNWLSTLLRGAINLMRMLPFLVLAYLLYYGLPALGIKPSAWGAAWWRWPSITRPTSPRFCVVRAWCYRSARSRRPRPMAFAPLACTGGSSCRNW